jgi:hypothetical protein
VPTYHHRLSSQTAIEVHEMTKTKYNQQLPFGITLSEVSRARLAKLRALERYNISFLAERLVSGNGYPSTSVASAVLEFKRYMSLATLGYRRLPVPSQEVDDVWHAFLLFTREYDAFCRKTVGFFVHHVPTTKSERTRYNQTGLTEAYQRVFGVNLSKVGDCYSCRAGSNLP